MGKSVQMLRGFRDTLLKYAEISAYDAQPKKEMHEIKMMISPDLFLIF
jgi:hypothetical protein